MPAEVVYFNAAAQGAYLSRRLSRDWHGEEGSAAEHRFSFAVKVRCKRFHLSPIQPLRQNLWFCHLPLHRGAEKRTQYTAVLSS